MRATAGNSEAIGAAIKRALFDRFTQAVRRHAGIPDGALAPVYIILRDIAPTNWGVFGGTITLENLRNPAPEAKPI